MMTTPVVDLFPSALCLYPGGEVRSAERQMTNDGSGTWQIATFHVETDAEVHSDYWRCTRRPGKRCAARPVRCGPGGQAPSAGGFPS